jgi:hypothetical protein
MSNPTRLKSTMLYQTLANIDRSQLIYRVLLTKNVSLAPELIEIERLEKKNPVIFNAFYSFLLDSIEERSEYRPVVPLFTSSSRPVINLYRRERNRMHDYYFSPLANNPSLYRSTQLEGSMTRLKPLPIEPRSNRNSEVIYVDPFAGDSEDNASSKSFSTILKSPLALFKKKQ